MARIPDHEIERLKSEVSLLRLIEAAGVELKKQGKDYVGRCLWHDDRTPSLLISPDKNLWHCLGACQTGGSVIDWTMKVHGVSFRHAVELLRDDPALAAASAVPGVKRSTVRHLPAPVAADADDQALLDQVTGYYHDTLKQSPEALAYLQARGLDHPEVIDHFKLGFANRTLGLRLPARTRKAGAELRARLERVGLVRASGHEHFNGSLVIPVLDTHGHTTEIYGRKITDGLRPGTPSHLYLPGPHRGVFNPEALQASKEIILCEALIDALTFWCTGFRNVTAAYGVEGFTDDHLAAFKQHGTARVLIAFDRDEAGERGAEKVAAQLMGAGIDCFRIQFPKGMDANDYALKLKPAPKSLGLVIRKAAWMGNGKPKSEVVTVPVGPVQRVSEPAPTSSASVEVFSLAADVPTPESEPLPASPLPSMPAPKVNAEVKDSEIVLVFGDRRYRVRGLSKNLSPDTLKVNILVSREVAFYVDTLDLYASRARASFTTQAAVELGLAEGVIKADLGGVLLKLEALQDDTIRKALEPAPTEAVSISDDERTAALALLKAPDLLDRLLADFETCGLVGERTNKLTAYLAAVSRKLDKPLAVLVQSTSAAGKSSLMDAVLAFMPEEERIKYSAMTGQSLFYMGETNLKHKILAIVEEEGASRASYALKLLQSEGELTMASTGKDPATGNLVTQEYRVEGPVMMFLTTTARDLDEELMNRCLVLSVDEGREQTRAIHRLQREKRTLDGLLAKRERQALIALHQNAQRLLRPLDVLNPYARFLSFPDQTTRLRRDHEKYLTLIDAIAFLHQHQRTVKASGPDIEYIEVTLDDIRLANDLAHDVLGRSLDELPPQTRRLLKLIDGYVTGECVRRCVKRTDFHFSRRALREALGGGDTQLKRHLARLVELEYLVAHRTRTQGFEYELVYDTAGDDERLRFPGLADLDQLARDYDAARSGQKEDQSGSGRPLAGAQSAGGRGEEIAANADRTRFTAEIPIIAPKTQVSGANGKGSYPHSSLAAA